MQTLRRLILTDGRLTALVLACVLAMKLLVPGGWMVSNDHGRIVVTICSGSAPKTVVMPMPGMAHHDTGGDHGKSDAKPDMPCAFAGLSAGMLGGVDPALLVLALAFAAILALLPVRPRVRRALLRLRPPLRGPPLHPRLR
ncbi:DUF2946 family protein [Sphingomonas sp. RS2018]